MSTGKFQHFLAWNPLERKLPYTFRSQSIVSPLAAYQHLPKQRSSLEASRHYAIILMLAADMQIPTTTSSLQNLITSFTIFPNRTFQFSKCRDVMRAAKIKRVQNCPLAANFLCLLQYQWSASPLIRLHFVSCLNRPARCLAHLVGMKPNFQGCYCGWVLWAVVSFLWAWWRRIITAIFVDWWSANLFVSLLLCYWAQI